MEDKSNVAHLPEPSMTEGLEIKFLFPQLSGWKTEEEYETCMKALRESYKDAQYPTLYAREHNEDIKILTAASKELNKGVKAPSAYFLSQALSTMYEMPQMATSDEIVELSEDVSSKIKSFIYASLSAGENFTTLLWAPNEILRKVLGEDFNSESFQRLYLRILDAYNVKVITACQESYNESSPEFQSGFKNAYKHNSHHTEAVENRKEVAGTVGKIAARGGIVVFMHSYGLVACIITGILAAVSFILSIITYYTVYKITSLLFLTTTICSGIFIWQAQIKSGENLKQFVLSFYIGMGSFFIALGTCAFKIGYAVFKGIMGG